MLKPWRLEGPAAGNSSPQVFSLIAAAATILRCGSGFLPDNFKNVAGATSPLGVELLAPVAGACSCCFLNSFERMRAASDGLGHSASGNADAVADHFIHCFSSLLSIFVIPGDLILQAPHVYPVGAFAVLADNPVGVEVTAVDGDRGTHDLAPLIAL